jgi:hypothetical protein
MSEVENSVLHHHFSISVSFSGSGSETTYYHVSWDAKPWGVAKYGFLRDQKAFCTDHSRYNIIYNDT